MNIVAVRDRAIDAYGMPIFVQALGQAVRSFTDEINNTSSAMYAHPDDYDLYELGHFEPTTGQITAVSTPRLLAIGKDHKTAA